MYNIIRNYSLLFCFGSYSKSEMKNRVLYSGGLHTVDMNMNRNIFVYSIEFYVFKFFKKSAFISREREHKQSRGREREREKESQADSVWSVQSSIWARTHKL